MRERRRTDVDALWPAEFESFGLKHFGQRPEFGQGDGIARLKGRLGRPKLIRTSDCSGSIWRMIFRKPELWK